jgi:hypothetical protein
MGMVVPEKGLFQLAAELVDLLQIRFLASPQMRSPKRDAVISPEFLDPARCNES